MPKSKRGKGLSIGSGLSDLAARMPIKLVDPEKSKAAKEAAKARRASGEGVARHPWRSPFKRGQLDDGRP